MVQHTSEDDSISYDVVEEIARATGGDPVDLAPLYETVDPDALDALCEIGFDGHLTFQHAGCWVIVDGEGEVRASTDREDVESELSEPRLTLTSSDTSSSSSTE